MPSIPQGPRTRADQNLNATDPADLTPTAAWSRRVRWVGGLIQVAFAALWLVRGSRAIGGGIALVLILLSTLMVIGAVVYAIRTAAGTAPRPKSPRGASGSGGT